MKKIVLIGLLLPIAAAMFGQKSKVSLAYALATMEQPDLVEAKTTIDEALQNPETPNDARTWYYAGSVYEKLVDQERIKASFNPEEENKEARGTSVLKAYGYFVKADSLERIPDEKGKIKARYGKDIANIMKTYYPAELTNYGFLKYQQRRNDEAIAIWEKYLNMPNLPFLKDAGLENDSTYVTVEYLTASAAQEEGGDYTDTAIKYFNKVKNTPENIKFSSKDEFVSNSYLLLARLYAQEKKDTAMYVKALKEGFAKYPTNPLFVSSLADYYLEKNVADSALIFVNEMIKTYPQESELYFVRGVVYENTNRPDEALADYEKTFSLNPANDRAVYKIGDYYLKRADKTINAANLSKDPKAAAAGKAQAAELYKKAEEYLEKARVANPKNRSTMQALKSLYYKLYTDKSAKYQEIDKALKTF